jgi:3-phytase
LKIGVWFAVIVAGVGCLDQGEPGEQTSAATTPTMVTESFVSPLDTMDNVDSPAAWITPDGAMWLFATAKDSHVIMHYDGSTGAMVRRVGSPGGGPGQFMRPNGILVHDDLLIVVERDNRRVQVLRLPEMTSMGTFGQDELIKPYGVTGVEREGGLDLWITDDFDVTGTGGAVYEARVKQFRMAWDGQGVQGEWVRNIGEPDGPGRLTVVESILADPAHDRLIVADEDETQRNLKIYALDGTFNGQVVATGLFTAEPEGLALYACGTEGYIVSADQSPDANRFHVLDRVTLDPLGTFAGPATRNTDGVAVLQSGEGSMFYAVHDDQGVTGFRWSDVAGALGLRDGCSMQ